MVLFIADVGFLFSSDLRLHSTSRSEHFLNTSLHTSLRQRMSANEKHILFIHVFQLLRLHKVSSISPMPTFKKISNYIVVDGFVSCVSTILRLLVLSSIRFFEISVLFVRLPLLFTGVFPRP